MVTASRLQQGRAQALHQKPPVQQAPNHAQTSQPLIVGTDPSSWSAPEDAVSVGSVRDSLHGGLGHGTSVAESTDSYSSAPLYFGEQLVLETYMRNKGRRYDRKRQDELSQPRGRNHGALELEMLENNRTFLNQAQLKNLVSRLAKPKRFQNTDDAAVTMVTMNSIHAEVSKAPNRANAELVFRRLAAPRSSRGYDLTPGEKICMMYNRWKPGRTVNLDHLADMAKPKKRGGRAQSWGVSASFSIRSDGSVSMMGTPCDHSFISQQLPPAPMSARGPCASHQSARPIETSKTERSPEVVEDYSFPRPAIESHRQGGAVAAAAENWRPVESRPPVAGAPRDGRLPQVAPCDAVEFNDGDCSDYYDEETDDPVSYRPVSLQAYSATAAAAQPVQSAQADEEGSDDEEPIFPQFGFAGQRTSRPADELKRAQAHERDLSPTWEDELKPIVSTVY